MDEQTKRKMIRKYFKPFPKWTIWLILIGVIVFLIGTKEGLVLGLLALRKVGADVPVLGLLALRKVRADVLVLGLLALGIGILGIVMYSSGKPTDQQVDNWFREDIRRLQKKALDVLGTVEEELIKEPLTIYKPIFWKVSGINSHEVMMKKGKDGLVRFSIWDVAIFHLTDKYLGCFRATFNFLKGETVNESTEEFFYKDIVKVGTAQESVILKNGKKITNAESFVLKVASGDSISVRDITLKLEAKGTKVVPTSPMEKTIQAIRTMLREKKI